jgi:hypothetical protein
MSVKAFRLLPQTFHRSSPNGNKGTNALQGGSLEVSEIVGLQQECCLKRKQTSIASHTDLSSL